MAGRKPKLPQNIENVEATGETRGAKRSITRIDVANELRRLNYEPLVEMIKIARDPTTDQRTKLAVAQELLGYCAPKLKQTEQKITTEEGDLASLLALIASQGRPKP